MLGLTLIAQGIAYLRGWPDVGLVAYAFMLMCAASGVSLLIGFLTPLAAILAGLSALCMVFLWNPVPHIELFNSLLLTNIVVTAAAIAFLGPGAFSLDSRLFGRREIIIARGPASPKL